MARALPQPRLEVVPARPLVGWLAKVRVTEHAPLPGTTAHRMVVKAEDGALVRVVYDVGAGRRVPAAVGADIALRYYPPRDDGTGGAALVAATPRGRALAFLVIDDGLPAGVLPGGATVALRDAGDHAAYTEVRRLPSLCVARVEHEDVAFTTEEATVWVSPGTARRVQVAATPFDLVVFDASRALDERCPGERLGHLSWALVALGDGAEDG